MVPAGPKMQNQQQRNQSLYQQTVALLWKNIIMKWRMRMQSFQEWFSALVLNSVMVLLLLTLNFEQSVEVHRASLGQLNELVNHNLTALRVVYTPDTKMTREIMGKIETISVLKGIRTEIVGDEKAMDVIQEENDDIIGVVFVDDVSYRLRFPLGKVVSPSDYIGQLDICYDNSSDFCNSPRYWFEGFLSLQSSIDSALIEHITNHSVWNEMKSIGGIRMGSPFLVPTDNIESCMFFLAILVAMSPFMYFLSQNVSREKRKMKEVMKSMGLRETAFWLSWGLLYAVHILISSLLLTLLLNNMYFTQSSFSAMFYLFYLYGISSICFCFVISSLLKKPKATSLVVFLLIFIFGILSLGSFLNIFPAALEWILSIFCPFAFGTGIAKIFNFQKYGRPFNFLDLMSAPYTYALILDSVLYILLTLYFEKVIPDKYGVPYPPLFFLKKSYWLKSRSGLAEGVMANEQGSIFNDNVEPVPPELEGKEAIRLNNIKKTYEVKTTKTEALRGLSLNIFEDQITAVLGHSGAGKTTLLNILSGLSEPSGGSASIFKYNISEKADMEHIRSISAVCPQFNIQFEFLTVKENLKTFAKIKGVPSNEIENEVQTLLTLLDINAMQNTRANQLSGGQKRKLSLAITFLGQPKVLLLDEPTAGLDPYSRQRVWSFLNERKAGRVILFTTQFMDEADILADRKAFISHGRLTCVGSSLFLKKKWGIGYHLRMHVSDSCDCEKTTSLVRRYIPAAKLSGQRENELRYTLPLENVAKFPDLFNDMDHRTDLGVINYGVTMTTLEDVFLKLEGNEIIGAEDDELLHREEKRGEMERSQSLLSDTGRATMRGLALWRHQACTIARMHFLNLKRETKVWGSLLLLSGLLLVPFITELASFGIWMNLHYVELHPRLYFEPGKQSFTGTSGLLILNDTGTSIEDFIRAVKSQNILVETISGNSVSDQLVHNGAIKVALEGKEYRFTLMCHTEITNCFPVLVNIISNAYLQMFNSTAHLRIWSHLFVQELDSNIVWYTFRIYAFGTIVLLPAFPPHFAMRSVSDYKRKTHSQLRVSGIFPSAYWFGHALVDITLHCILLLLGFWPWFLRFSVKTVQRTATIIFCFVSFILGYSFSVVSLLYVVSFTFRNKRHPSSFWSFILMLAAVLTMSLMSIFALEGFYLDYLLNLILPATPLFSFFISIVTILAPYTDHYEELTTEYVNELLFFTFVPYFHGIVFTLLLRFLVVKYDRPVMRRDPMFRISPQRKSSHQNPEGPSDDEDRDVQDEKARVQIALTTASQEEKPVVIVHNLRKEYKSGKACSCFKKNKEKIKVATRTVSFCVKKGEVLGLLGPNGAGKSTTLSIIIGETDPSAGQVLIKGVDAPANEENTPGFLGYCPQENALWSNLTVKEHLEIYAAVKGIQKDAAAVAINRLVEALELQEHFKKAVKRLSDGIARKLCFALSLLGSPPVMLLDEPTTGLDPKGKRQVWKAIHAILKEKDQGAILTTHHMEEAEAVCDRIAIMVTGQLRCLGSIQYLKSRFGKNYLLQIKVKGVEQGELLNTHILQVFPRAARQERLSTLLVYKVPMENALPLSRAFSMLEEAKRRFSLEEYSFSLNTLEQVFLEVCKEQEREDADMVLDTIFEWRQLQEAAC
uniref:ABC-type organic anion transporter ABCA8-like isoform X2 n=1 Tax=Pogona vitticeps TaxID=103695 RepID=A0ABM5FN96_9SAUR